MFTLLYWPVCSFHLWLVLMLWSHLTRAVAYLGSLGIFHDFFPYYSVHFLKPTKKVSSIKKILKSSCVVWLLIHGLLSHSTEEKFLRKLFSYQRKHMHICAYIHSIVEGENNTNKQTKNPNKSKTSTLTVNITYCQYNNVTMEGFAIQTLIQTCTWLCKYCMILEVVWMPGHFSKSMKLLLRHDYFHLEDTWVTKSRSKI